MKKQIIALMALLILAVPVPLQKAYAAEPGDAGVDVVNNLVGPKAQYNTMLSPVYLRNNLTEEYISPQSGELTLTQTDYVLPGRNGLDLEIKRIYKNSAANTREMRVKYVQGVWVDYVDAGNDTSSFYEDRYNLGMGMRFSFPTLQIIKNSDWSEFKYLHTESGDVYSLELKVMDGEAVYVPENQTVSDVVIKPTPLDTDGQPNPAYKYMMVRKDGRKTYFADDGRILKIADRYGNEIVFSYSDIACTAGKTKKLITAITDSVGRTVTIEYKEDGQYQAGAAAEGHYSADDSHLASQNPNTSNSGDLGGRFQVIVNLPGSRKIVYDKTAALLNETRQVVRTRLQRVYDVDGKPKYHYWYEQPELGFTYFNGGSYSAYNRYEYLVQVDFCKTNRIKRYVYDTYTRQLSDSGSMQYRKIVERQELVKKGFDNARAMFPDKFVCDVKDKVFYKYTKEADGYGDAEYRAKSSLPGTEGREAFNSYLKNTYRYYSEKTDLQGTAVKYTYDGQHELIRNEEAGRDHRQEVLTEYDEMKLPKKKETVVYNASGGQATGSPVRKVENFRYDRYGNLTNYTGPLAERGSEGNPVDNEHTVTYSYATDRYHVLKEKVWKQDRNTTAQVLYTVDEKGNILQEKRVHADNGDRSVITDYAYDRYGNMITKTTYSDDNTYTTRYEYGTDADGTDHKGAYLTREYAVLKGAEVGRKYIYHFDTGEKKADIDPNGYRTNYEIDMLGRITRITGPDETYKQFAYNEYVNANMKIEYRDPEDNRTLYEYDILGDLVKESIYDQERWNTRKEYQYDFKGNKIKEIDANGHSVVFEYDSNNRLLKKTFYEKDSVRRESMSLTYTLSPDAATSMLVALTDEEDYTSNFHYDILNRLIKLEVTPDHSTYFETATGYDYTGNKTFVTDALGNGTQYAYDDLGRLAVQTDALHQQTRYTYNSLGKVLSVEEPGGRLIRYSYDNLGRVLEERIAKKDFQDYSYKKYTYDAAGNLLTLEEGSMEGGADKLSGSIFYSYDNMNRVIDENRKIDAATEGHLRYQYDANGNRTAVIEYADASGTRYIRTAYAYDFAGRLKQEEGMYREENGAEGPVNHGYYLKKYTADYAGNLLLEKQFNGTGDDTVAYSYDHRNRISAKTEPYAGEDGSKITAYSYDKKGNLVSESIRVQEESRVTTYRYNGLGKLTAKTDPMYGTTRYIYDANGNLVKEIDPRYAGMSADAAPGMEYAYDPLNRQIQRMEFDGSERTVLSYREYDGRGNVTKEGEGEGYNAADPSASRGKLYVYDAQNRVVGFASVQTAADHPGGYSMRYAYDGSGRKIRETDAYGNETVYVYYLNGTLKEKKYPDQYSETYSYDLSGKMEVVKTDRSGNVTGTWNTVFGKPRRVEYPDGTAETFAYTPKGELAAGWDRAGNIKYYAYDPSGNLISSKEYYASDGYYKYYRLVQYAYNEADNLVSSETFLSGTPAGAGTQENLQPAGDRTDYAYDRAGRLVRTAGPNGRETVRQYDAKGNLIAKKEKVSDETYDVKRYAYDVQSRVTTETTLVETADMDFLPGAEFDREYGTRVKSAIAYGYDRSGRLKYKKDACGYETRYTYDLDNRMISKVEPTGAAASYNYDRNGNLIEEKNTRGYITGYDYDSLNRLVRKKAPAAGGGQAITLYLYDAMGNLVKEIQPDQYVPALDTPPQAALMKGMTYTYDGMNRRERTLSPEGELLQVIAYDANGNVKKVVDGLRFTGDISVSAGTEYAYDGLNRVVRMTDALGGSTVQEYDVLGNLTKRTDALGHGTLYAYSPDGLPVKITFDDGSAVAYTYDKLGRKTSQKDQNGSVTSYGYNAFGKVREEKDPYGAATLYKYDLNGNLTVWKDKRGSETYMKYDQSNRPVEKRLPMDSDGSGNLIYAIEKYSYDEAGNLTKKAVSGTRDTASVREINYTYYENNQVETVTDTSGAYTRYAYDKNGNIVKTEKLVVSDRYDITTYRYDSRNRLLENMRLADEADIADAEAIPNLASLRDSQYPGKIRVITGFIYDLLGNKIGEISPAAYGYTEDDTASRDKYTTKFTYDLLNRLEKIVHNYNGQEVYAQYTYDSVGNKTGERNERGFETQYGYDSLNRLKTVTDAMGHTLTYGYDPAGNKTTETNAAGQTLTYAYDRLNRLSTATDAYGTVIQENIYDANGNITKAIDAKGYLSGAAGDARYGTLYTYDLANRPVRVADPEASARGTFTMKYEYNAFGEKTKQTDALGNTTAYEYDAAGRLVKVTDALGISVSYGYDRTGSKLYMTDGRGKPTDYAYGAFGRLIKVTDAEGRSMTYRYDLAGNVASLLDRNGNTTRYAYDNRNLPVSRRIQETGDSITYSYDEAGNRTGMTDESGTSAYTYDRNNRLVEIRKDGAVQISYTYDEIGNIRTVTDRKGYTVTYAYDKSSRMETVGYDGRVTTYAYDKNGNRQSVTYQGGVREEYGYDKNDRLLTLTNKNPGGGVISSYTYTYDLAGRQETKTDSYGLTRYAYDRAGRILKAEAPGKTTVYAYDRAGNRISLNETYTSAQPSGFVDSGSGNEIQYIVKKSEYVYTSTNRLIKLVEKMYEAAGKEVLQKTVAYLYDANGNEIRQGASYLSNSSIRARQETKGALYRGDAADSIDALIERTSNTFDGFNRLKAVEKIFGGVRTTAAYTYNGDDLRVRKEVRRSDNGYATEVTHYLYDRQHVVLETDGSDSVKVRYIRGINYIARTGDSGAYSCFLYNGHGDVAQTVSEAGVVENTYDYDIWGNPTLTIEQYSCSIRYAGEYLDNETGLYYLRARYYDSYLGRFISEDSYWGEDGNPLSLNLYTYAENNPIMYTDPTGHNTASFTWDAKDSSSSRTMGIEITPKGVKLTGSNVRASYNGGEEYEFGSDGGSVFIPNDSGSASEYSPEDRKPDTGQSSGSSYTAAQAMLEQLQREQDLHKYMGEKAAAAETQAKINALKNMKNRLDESLNKGDSSAAQRIQGTIDTFIRLQNALKNGDTAAKELLDKVAGINNGTIKVTAKRVIDTSRPYEPRVTASLDGAASPYMYRDEYEPDEKVSPVTILDNGDIVLYDKSSGEFVTWNYIGADVNTIARAATAIGGAARSKEAAERISDSWEVKVLTEKLPSNSKLDLSAEQLSLLYLLDPEGVRDYLSWIHSDRAEKNKVLREEVYKILTGKEPAYYERHLFSGWDYTSKKEGNLWSEVKSDADILLDRAHNMPKDFISVVEPTITTGLIMFGLGEVSMITAGIEVYGIKNAVTMYTHGQLANNLGYYNNLAKGTGKTWSVDPAMQAADEAAGVLKNGSYIKNPTAQNMNSLIKDGSNYVGNSKFNGQYMYVVDTQGNVIIGSRAGQHMPHPTLVGGSNPQVQAAGIVEIRGGKIYKVDNASGHFKPGAGSLDAAQDAFSKLPSNVFSKDFQGYVPYGK